MQKSRKDIYEELFESEKARLFFTEDTEDSANRKANIFAVKYTNKAWIEYMNLSESWFHGMGSIEIYETITLFSYSELKKEMLITGIQYHKKKSRHENDLDFATHCRTIEDKRQFGFCVGETIHGQTIDLITKDGVPLTLQPSGFKSIKEK